MISFKIYKLFILIASIVQSLLIHLDVKSAKIEKKGNIIFFPENYKKISNNLWFLRAGDVLVITITALILLEAYQPEMCHTTGLRSTLMRLLVCSHWSLNALVITASIGVIFSSVREFLMSDNELKLQAKFMCFSEFNPKVKSLYKQSYSFWFGWCRPIAKISKELNKTLEK